jgi:hypothetical protein
MLTRWSSRATPILFLVLSSLWVAATTFPLFYSLLFPNADIEHTVRALEGRETLSGDMAHLVQQVTGSVGRLKRAIQIAAYFSAEYKVRAPRTTKTAQVSYLAWFEERPKPTILVVTRTEVDDSSVSVRTDEGSLLGALRVYLLPAAALAFSVYRFRRKRSFESKIDPSDHGPGVEMPKG